MNSLLLPLRNTMLGRGRRAALEEKGVSFVEVVIAAAILMIAFLALLEMLTGASKGIQGNKVRSIAQSEAVYGVEMIKSRAFSSIPTSPKHQYVTQTVQRDGLNFTRVIHYQITDSNHDGQTDSQDYIIGTVTVTWERPAPTASIEMSVYKLP